MHYRFIGLMIGLYLLTGAAALAQQNTCPALVDAAYAATALECARVSPGEVCYGNRPLTVTAAGNENFTRPGHRVTGLQVLQSGPMNPASGEWGVARLAVQANTPDQIVTLIVLGAVQMEDASEASEPVNFVPARVTFSGGTFLRAQPSEEAEQVAPLVVGQTVPATGRLEDGSWFRLILDDGRSGWVRADLVRLQGELDWLAVVDADSPEPETPYSPLQALQFTSAIEDATCSEAPDSGILLQTALPVTMQVNDMTLHFDGTLFLQAASEFFVHVLEGDMTITAGGETVTATAGNRVRVRYNPGEDTYTTPRQPEPYFYARMLPLPLELLPREVDALAFNLEGVVTPAAPDGSVFGGLMDESPCTVAAVNEVRLRGGPGREFPIVGALYPNESAQPDARAPGSDSMLWWRLAEGIWVRTDIVLNAGACDDIPQIEPPSPPQDAEEAETS